LFNIDWWQTMPSDKDSIPCKKWTQLIEDNVYTNKFKP
jgi:hypothetical protein